MGRGPVTTASERSAVTRRAWDQLGGICMDLQVVGHDESLDLGAPYYQITNGNHYRVIVLLGNFDQNFLASSSGMGHVDAHGSFALS